MTEPLVAVAQPATEADKMWEQFGELLTPEKAIQRIEDRAKFVVSTVAVVGTIITGLGLILGQQIASTAWGRIFATTSIGLAAASVALAVVSLVVGGMTFVRPSNLLDVKRWYLGQYRRGRVVGASGLLLVASLGLAAIGSSRVMATFDARQPTLIVSIVKNDRGWDIASEARMAGLAPNDGISLVVSGVGSGRTREDLAGQFARAGAKGEASASLKIEKLAGYSAYEFLLKGPNVTCQTVIDPTLLSDIPTTQQMTCSEQ